jgi:adenylylsulfate kinase
VARRKGFAVWITGIPGSGKSTIAKVLKNELLRRKIHLQILDSDSLRKIITPKPEYTERERDYFYNVMAWIGKLLVDNRINVVFAATAHKRAYRDKARKWIKKFLEVYCDCPLEVCMKRDPKNLYKMALEGKISDLPGLQTPFEEPRKYHIRIETHKLTLGKNVSIIIKELKRLKYIY